MTVGVAVPQQGHLGLQFLDPGCLGLQFLYEPACLRQGDDGVGVRLAHWQWRPTSIRAQECVAVGFTVLPALPWFLPKYPHVGRQTDPALDCVVGPYPADLAQGGVGHRCYADRVRESGDHDDQEPDLQRQVHAGEGGEADHVGETVGDVRRDVGL